MNISKPQNIDKYDLVVIMGLRDAPVTPQDPMNMVYTKSTLAVNRYNDTLLVYVNSATKAGIKQFKKDYPTAIIQDISELDVGKWTLSAFPMDYSDDATPLDTYFKGRHRDLSYKLEKEAIKNRGKKK